MCLNAECWDYESLMPHLQRDVTIPRPTSTGTYCTTPSPHYSNKNRFWSDWPAAASEQPSSNTWGVHRQTQGQQVSGSYDLRVHSKLPGGLCGSGSAWIRINFPSWMRIQEGKIEK